MGRLASLCVTALPAQSWQLSLTDSASLSTCIVPLASGVHFFFLHIVSKIFINTKGKEVPLFNTKLWTVTTPDRAGM